MAIRAKACFVRKTLTVIAIVSAWLTGSAHADFATKVIDTPTRTDVTVRSVALLPAEPKAAVILLAGGDGGLRIFSGGTIGRLDGNFLIRSRKLFADQGIATVVVDAPSDRMRPPYLAGFRTTDEHARDLGAVVDWLAQETRRKVWLVGTSRGTQSAAFAGLKLQENPSLAGIVLTSSILVDASSPPVPAMPLETFGLPVLVVHHDQDSCQLTHFSDLQRLTDKLPKAVATKVMVFSGGVSWGDPCQARAYHGYNGLEADVVGQIAQWLLSH